MELSTALIFKEEVFPMKAGLEKAAAEPTKREARANFIFDVKKILIEYCVCHLIAQRSTMEFGFPFYAPVLHRGGSKTYTL